MATVYLALGSNIGDSRSHIVRAIQLLGGVLGGVTGAPLYTSRAVGYTDQPDFTNTAVTGTTNLEPAALLDAVKGIEQRVGRTETFRWGPREIDIDIVFYNDLVLESPELTIPHPRYRQRDFVLRPLLDLTPGLKDPVTHLPLKKLLDDLPADERSIVDVTG